MSQSHLFLILSFFSGFAYGQNNHIAQMATWKPKEGQLQNFETGYKQHLNWHKTNGDQWGWYGWSVVSGPRYGQFVDATFGHQWTDFDQAIKPAEDMAENRLHVFPFGDLQTIFKMANYPKASTLDTFALKTKLLKLVTLTVDDMNQSVKVAEKLKDFYVSKQIKTFKTYQVVDGGVTNQLILLLGFSSWDEYAISENFSEKLFEIERSLKVSTIHSVVSETMVYRADMSWFPN